MFCWETKHQYNGAGAVSAAPECRLTLEIPALQRFLVKILIGKWKSAILT
jgi:hypothetical protein